MPRPIVTSSPAARIAAAGASFEIHEWSGSEPEDMHVHHSDDEAWHILEGTLTFRFEDGDVDAPAGTTVFVPAGVPHTYFEAHGRTRYLVVMTPRVSALVKALHRTPSDEHERVMREHDSAILSAGAPAEPARE
jgi:mannose-6-phosphate isomerase-like protein (cupin superfamily)